MKALLPSNRRVHRDALPDVTEVSPPAAVATADSGARRTIDRVVAVARAVVGVWLVLVVSGAVAWSARRYVKTSHRFAITDVEVSGNKRRTSEDVAAEANLTTGTNVFAVDLDDARARLLADPWIADATLARRLPGTISVHVTEREPGAVVALGETYLATRDGDLFKRLDPGDPMDLPVVTGLAPEAVAEDREGARRTVRRAIELAGEYEQSPLGSRAPLQEIHVAGDGSFSLVVGKSAVLVTLGDPPFRKKLDQAARVFAELDRRGGKPQAVMLDNDARPDRVVVRMR